MLKNRREIGVCVLVTVSVVCVLWRNYESDKVETATTTGYKNEDTQNDNTKIEELFKGADRNTTFPPVPKAVGVNSSYDIGEKSLRIFFWTGWTPLVDYWWLLDHKTVMVECGVVTCQYTNNKSLHTISTSIIEDWENLSTWSCFLKNVNTKQYWIAHYQDNPGNQKFKSLASFNNLFNLSSNYHSKSDVQTPYGVCQKSSKGETLSDNYSEGKTGLVS